MIKLKLFNKFSQHKSNMHVHVGNTCTLNTAAYLSRSHFNVEIIPLVRNFQDFRPGKPIYPQPVSIDEQPAGTHSNHDVNTFRVLQHME